MIRLLATTALGLVLASAAFAQSPPSANTTSQQSSPSQDKSATPSTTAPSGAAQSQQTTTSQPQQSSGPSAQNTQSTAPSSGPSGSSTNAANSADNQSRPQNGTASSSTTNPPATQQSANPPAATNTNQAQDRSSQPPATSNQAQQAPSATGANQTQQAPATNQAQGERTGTNSQMAARPDAKLDRQQETKISASISHLNVRPLTNVNFSLSVGTVVPRDVQLSTLPPDVVEIVPQYRGYSFALVKDEIVVVDPSTYKIVTVLPYSGQSTATTTTRERSASKFSDRDREVIRKHARARIEERREPRTTGSSARTEIHVGDRVPESVEVEELPSTVYRDAPDLREYRYIHRDSRTYVVEPHERRVIEEID
ncbi:DUF1236 domain-containing protein [Bradyrhizobium sp. Gha]|uniref:DUF1236 domain-containing protein n=1 Tax=Bradyrhizobium sp. Gha TaxID=1855318 RepID=UPI0008E3C000|nr:DUF1236 domain-containing protein [Bradyrhizobium sp. Gha]SFI01833.1 Protein of unknown function [Bradyrhizobium sp. Gha]